MSKRFLRTMINKYAYMDQKLSFRNATIADKEAVFLLANQLSEFIKINKKIFTDNYQEMISDKKYL